VIEARGLAKRFGDRLVLRGIDLDAARGEVLGLIGPNGAGKTTTIKVLATLVAPDAGRARIDGKDLARDAAAIRGAIGYMPERFGLYDELSLREYLDFYARLHGLAGRSRTTRVERVLELTDLKPKAQDACEGLSKGVRQRLYVAKILLHDPAVLLLDEPASGLDPRARIEFRELLRELASQGKTILVSSHILSELEALSTRVAVVEGGLVRYSGPPRDVEAALSGTLALRVRVLEEPDAAKAAELLGREAGVKALRVERDLIRFELEGPRARVPELHKTLVTAAVPVYSFEVEAPGLEALFLRVTEGKVT
jgi:ABC-2 type transport system ATP-binding protein